jgi:hypothetical protein
MSKTEALPAGVKVILAFHGVSFFLWVLGQTGAVLAYDTVSAWGFQSPRYLVDPVVVAVNRAIGLTDTLVMLPLYLVAILGLLRQRFFGAVASWLVFGMSFYWPVEFFSQQFFFAEAEIRNMPISPLVAAVPLVTMFMAGWGTWYLARTRTLFR